MIPQFVFINKKLHKRFKMKKVLLSLAAASLLFVGCTEDKKPAETKVEAPKTETVAPAQEKKEEVAAPKEETKETVANTEEKEVKATEEDKKEEAETTKEESKETATEADKK